MKLGLLLSSPPNRPEVSELHRLVADSLRNQIEVYLYLIDEGALNLSRPELNDLIRRGVKLFVCAYSANKHNVPLDCDKAVFSGLPILVDIITNCDRFMAFTPCGVPRADARDTFGHGETSPTKPSRLLLTISEDPNESHRPAEAIRIAAGIGSWEKLAVDVLLKGPSSKILSSAYEEFIDSNSFENYLPIIKSWKRPIYISSDAEPLKETSNDGSFIFCDPTKEKELHRDSSFWIPF